MRDYSRSEGRLKGDQAIGGRRGVVIGQALHLDRPEQKARCEHSSAYMGLGGYSHAYCLLLSYFGLCET